MSVKPRHIAIVIAASAMLPACATVDLADVASPSVRADAPADVNVVKRAAAKLKTAFTQRGFGPNASKRKMHAAADMLLNGIQSTGASDADDHYNANRKSPALVTADILVANRHVEQTRRAAEIYLEMAPRDRDLVAELKDLEAALVASEKAVRTFTVALDDAPTSELRTLRGSVDRLRHVTDEFGIRVRTARSEKLALDALSRAAT